MTSVVIVEPDVQDFPVITGYTGMTALMVLVTVVAAHVMHLPRLINAHLINAGYTFALAAEL